MNNNPKFVLVKTYATKQQAKQAAPRSAAIIKHGDGRFIIKQSNVQKSNTGAKQ